jgi:hypothetical protein
MKKPLKPAPFFFLFLLFACSETTDRAESTTKEERSIALYLSWDAHSFLDLPVSLISISLENNAGEKETINIDNQDLLLSYRGGIDQLAIQSIQKDSYDSISLTLDFSKTGFKRIIQEETAAKLLDYTPTNESLTFTVTLHQPIQFKESTGEIHLMMDVNQSLYTTDSLEVNIQPVVTVLTIDGSVSKEDITTENSTDTALTTLAGELNATETDSRETAPAKLITDKQTEAEKFNLKEGIIIDLDKEKALVTLADSNKQMNYSTTDIPIKRLNDEAALTFNDLQIGQRIEITGTDIIAHPMHFIVKIERLINSNTLEFEMEILAIEDRVATDAIKALAEVSKIRLLNPQSLISANLLPADLPDQVLMFYGYVVEGKQIEAISLSVLSTIGSKLTLDLRDKSYTLKYKQEDDHVRWYVARSSAIINGRLMLIAPPVDIAYPIHSFLLNEQSQISIHTTDDSNKSQSDSEYVHLDDFSKVLKEQIDKGYTIDQLVAEGLFSDNRLSAKFFSLQMSKNTFGNRIVIEGEDEADTASIPEDSNDSESSGITTGTITTFVGIGLATVSALWAIYDFISRQIKKDSQAGSDTNKAEEANVSDTSKAVKKLAGEGGIDFSLDKERTPADLQELAKRRSLSLDATNIKIQNTPEAGDGTRKNSPQSFDASKLPKYQTYNPIKRRHSR